MQGLRLYFGPAEWLHGADCAWNNTPGRKHGENCNYVNFLVAASAPLNVKPYTVKIPLPVNAVYGKDFPKLEGIPSLPLPLYDSGNDLTSFRFKQDQPLLLIPSETKEVSIPVHAAVKGLTFIQACSLPPTDLYHRSMPQIASYEIIYENGGKISVPILLRRDVNDWNAALGALFNTALYAASASDSTRIQFGSYDWWGV